MKSEGMSWVLPKHRVDIVKSLERKVLVPFYIVLVTLPGEEGTSNFLLILLPEEGGTGEPGTRLAQSSPVINVNCVPRTSNAQTQTPNT